MRVSLGCFYNVGLKIFALYLIFVSAYFLLDTDDPQPLQNQAHEILSKRHSYLQITANQTSRSLPRDAPTTVTSRTANVANAKVSEIPGETIIRRKFINSKETINKVRHPQKFNDVRTTTTVAPPWEAVEEFYRLSSSQCTKEESLWRAHRQPGYIVRPCDCYQRNHLAETIAVNLDRLLNLTWEDVDSGLTNLDPGGHWRPSHCAPLRRVAVIIPYRDRGSHLRAFLSHTHPILQKQAVEYQIFVIEQNRPYVFNKGSLMNAGYLEVMDGSGFAPDCLLFHDVDLLVETETNLAMCRDVPTHFAANIDKFNYTLLYGKMFGGGVAIKPEQFRAINGYSNQFVGWGGEDDDFYRRVILEYRKIHRPPPEVSRYKMIPHSRDTANPVNRNSTKGYKTRPHTFRDGLGTVQYERVSLDHFPSYTRVLVNFPEASDNEEDTQLVHQSASR